MTQPACLQNHEPAGRKERSASRGHVVSNVWHGDLVAAERVPITSGSQATAALDALRLFVRCRRADALVTSEGTLRPVGLAVYALLSCLLRRRQLVLVEFLPGRKQGWSGAVIERSYRLLLGRAVRATQVMTAWERVEYVRRYRLDPVSTRHVPFYHLDDRDHQVPVPAAERVGVLASGRNSCDWPTLIDAARGQGWNLTIVCPGEDRPGIEDSARESGIRLMSDVARADHDRMLAEAVLFLAVLKDQGGSSGHVRLASAAGRATPVIVSAIPGVEGYEDLAVASVTPEDPAALRAAVNDALADREALQHNEAEVLRVARDRTYRVYTEEIRRFLLELGLERG